VPAAYLLFPSLRTPSNTEGQFLRSFVTMHHTKTASVCNTVHLLAIGSIYINIYIYILGEALPGGSRPTSSVVHHDDCMPFQRVIKVQVPTPKFNVWL
jgi:hypothetical protein